MCIYQFFLYNDDERNGRMLSDSSQVKVLIQYSAAASFFAIHVFDVFYSPRETNAEMFDDFTKSRLWCMNPAY
jgi:hypothetical protein